LLTDAFCSVPNIIVAAIAVSLIGFSVGPFFATVSTVQTPFLSHHGQGKSPLTTQKQGITLGSKLFNHEIRSTALAFVFVFAQMGGSVFPIITGVVASSAGVRVLQPMLTGLIAATTIAWLFVPQPKDTDNEELHQE
jgi:fucose permease